MISSEAGGDERSRREASTRSSAARREETTRTGGHFLQDGYGAPRAAEMEAHGAGGRRPAAGR